MLIPRDSVQRSISLINDLRSVLFTSQKLEYSVMREREPSWCCCTKDNAISCIISYHKMDVIPIGLWKINPRPIWSRTHVRTKPIDHFLCKTKSGTPSFQRVYDCKIFKTIKSLNRSYCVSYNTGKTSLVPPRSRVVAMFVASRLPISSQ